MMGSEQDLERLRARVEAAHARVVSGDYDGASAELRAVLPDLRAQLGAQHPEVRELVEDLDTIRQMAGMAGLVAEIDPTAAASRRGGWPDGR